MTHTPTLGQRHLFPTLEGRAYLNHAALSPPSQPVLDAAKAALDDFAHRGLGAILPWMDQRERLRKKMASFMGVSPQDIGFPPGTTRGIVDIAHALPLSAGDVILCFDGEFPSNVIPWMTIAQRHGARVERLPLTGFGDGTGLGLQRVEDALSSGRVRLIAVSAVQFQTGLTMPLRQLAHLAHKWDAECFVDGIQALGAMPMDMAELGIDYLVAGTHKWLMGLDGLAVAYASPAARERLRPTTAGWISHEDGLRFLFEGAGLLSYERPIKTSLDWMEGGVQTTAAFAGLEASVDLLTALKPERIYPHIQAYLDALEPGLQGLGLESVRPEQAEARSGILSVHPPEGRCVGAIVKELAAHGVSASSPDGLLRFSPHWPNAMSEIPHVLSAVEEVLVEDKATPGGDAA